MGLLKTRSSTASPLKAICSTWRKQHCVAEEPAKVIHQAVTGFLPPVDLALEKRLQKLLVQAVRVGLLSSAHDLSDGGLAVALAESCIAGGLGAQVILPGYPRPELPLFGEGSSRAIVSVEGAARERLLELAAKLKVPLLPLGEVGGDKLVIRVGLEQMVEATVFALKKIYEESIPCFMEQ